MPDNHFVPSSGRRGRFARTAELADYDAHSPERLVEHHLVQVMLYIVTTSTWENAINEVSRFRTLRKSRKDTRSSLG